MKTSFYFGMSWLVLGGCVLSGAAFAQQTPNAGTVLRGLQQDTIPRETAPLAPPTQAPAGVAVPSRQGGSVFVRAIHIEGMTAFDEATLAEQVRPWTGRDLTLSELEEAAAAIADFYRRNDLLARVWVPEQRIVDGVVTLRVMEGVLGQVIVDPSSQTRLSPDIATNRVTSRTQAGEPLHVGAVDEGVTVLNETPGVSAKAALRPGESRGETDVVLQVQDTPLVTGLVQADNAGMRAVGSSRLIGQLSLNDPLGQGEQISLLTAQSSRSSYGQASLRFPVSERGLTLGFSGSALRYSLGEEFEALGARGYAWTAGTSLSYPLRRSQDFSLSAVAGYDHKRLVSEASASPTGDSRIDVTHFGLNATQSDDWLGGGVNRGFVDFVYGHVGISDNGGLKKTDSAGARVGGYYGKVVVGGSRVQKVDDDTEAWVNATGQIASGNLDGTEKLALGGQSGIRAYPQSEAYGDEALVAQFELRHRLRPDLQLAGFYDVGAVRLHHSKWDGWQTVTDQPNSYILQGIGLGVTWQPLDTLQLRGIVAQPLGPNYGHDANGNDSDGKKARPRVWLSAALTF